MILYMVKKQMLKLKKNKKGSIVDIFFIIIALVFFSITVLFGTKIATEFQNKIADNEVYQTDAPEAIVYTEQAINNYTFSVNSGFLLLLIFFIIATLSLAALVRIHPMFIPIFLIALTFLILFCGIMSNVYQGVAEAEEMGSTVERYMMMHKIMVGIPFIVGIFGIILMIVMYKNYQVG